MININNFNNFNNFNKILLFSFINTFLLFVFKSNNKKIKKNKYIQTELRYKDKEVQTELIYKDKGIQTKLIYEDKEIQTDTIINDILDNYLSDDSINSDCYYDIINEENNSFVIL